MAAEVPVPTYGIDDQTAIKVTNDDTIGATYSVTRRTEPRIAAQVWAALGPLIGACSSHRLG